MKSFIKRHKLEITISIVLVLYVIILQVTKVYSPITYFLGIEVPTTGTTRAWLQLIQGRIREAFQFNALFLLAPAIAFAYYQLAFKNNKHYTIPLIIFSFIYLIYGIIRNL